MTLAGAPGARRNVVLLSGMLGDEALWAGVRPELRPHVDVRWLPIHLDASVPAMAHRVLSAGGDDLIIVGHSLGAIVALQAALAEPSRVRARAVERVGARSAPDQIAAWDALAARVVAGRFDDVVAELARATLPPSRRDDAALVEASEGMAGTVGADGLLRQLAAQRGRVDLRPRLAELRMPVLVLTGREDQVCPADRQEELRAGCVRATLAALDCGHMSPLEQPSEVAEVLTGWLDGLGSR